MKDNMKNLKEASNLILKDIYVTDELKRKTLEKCTNKREFKIKPAFTGAFSMAIVVSFGIFFYVYHKPAVMDKKIAKAITEEYKNSSNKEAKIQEVPKTETSSNLDKPNSVALGNKNNAKNDNPAPEKKSKDAKVKDPNNIPQTKSVDAASENNTGTALQNKDDSNKSEAPDNVPQNKIEVNNSKVVSNSKSVNDSSSDNNSSSYNNSNNNSSNSDSNKEINQASQVHLTSVPAPEPLTVEKAEEYFGSKILLPSYIPEGFKLADISIPDDKEKCIKLEYSSDSADFEVLQSKNLSKLDGTKNISIGSSTAYISSVKEEGTNTITTEIAWIKDSIQYSLTSSLPEDSLIKIAESIK